MELSKAWGKTGGGWRPSSAIQLGAILTVIAALLPHFHAADWTEDSRRLVAWITWTVALACIGLGLVRSAMRPWLSWLAAIPGAMHLIQAAAIAGIFAHFSTAVFVYIVLAIPKGLALLVFAIVDRENLDRLRRVAILVTAALVMVKSFLHAFFPRLADHTLVPDVIVNLLAALSFWLLAMLLRREEDLWAAGYVESVIQDFSRFNNPLDRIEAEPRN